MPAASTARHSCWNWRHRPRPPPSGCSDHCDRSNRHGLRCEVHPRGSKATPGFERVAPSVQRSASCRSHLTLSGVTQSAGGPPARPSPDSQTALPSVVGPGQPARPPRSGSNRPTPPLPGPAQPPRPPRASAIRSPLDSLPTPAPQSVRLALWAWLASCLFPMIAITYALPGSPDVRAHQRAIALIETPNATAVSLDRAVTVTVWIAIASLALPIVLRWSSRS